MSNEAVDGRRRKILLGSLALGLSAGTGCCGMVVAAEPSRSSAPPRPLSPRRSIHSMSGPVWINGQAARPQMIIGPDDHLETGHDAHLIARVGNDALLLRAGTELQLGAALGARSFLRLVSGAMLAVFGARREALAVQMPTATIGIRGTGIYAVADPDQGYVCTCYGKVRLSTVGKAPVGQDIVTQRHGAARYVLARPQRGRLILPAPLAGHTDAELGLLESLVGRQPPFPRPGPHPVGK